MSLSLHSHPLASFCHKVLIALYENATPFEAVHVDLGNEASRAAFLSISPLGKMPVLRDEARDRTIPETTIIIEYLDQYYPGRTTLIPDDFDKALEVRLWDRFFDLHVQDPMQRIVGERLRGGGDPARVAEAEAALRKAYCIIERQLGEYPWIAGDSFTMADCAAAPALFYSETLVPFVDQAKLQGYYNRLLTRPSFARVLEEARPYFKFYPYRERLPARFRPDEAAE
ncbi:MULTISPECIES: glutathione S-transferase family protein [unclassified Rhizobium]|uniref:glutathione S-transferase family protein n=1 Tax=unclassified Rhizobium TaxID=2613769 RepID=UPI001042C3F0|nr:MULTISPECIES: glutathione S-transferase family protein [unclassified Rhizobium]MBB3399191.1 glutathione S-transferase [Rhizobium sp. BK060]MBB4169922.1 glutathione S-transferase [Rhizobium sp. BK538]TCM66663.1 glutathione S-transferase [Rhizobium sp. BK068]